MPVNGKRYILSYEKSENDLSALVVADPEIILPNGNIKVVKILFGDYADNILKELTGLNEYGITIRLSDDILNNTKEQYKGVIKMKKIPTLFKREFDEKTHKIINILPEVTEGMEWVLNGEGTATVKIDGSCCAIINGEFYKRYDAKRGKPVPEGAIKCQEEADPITGHLPCWVKVDFNNPADKWFVNAYNHTPFYIDDINGTYEAIGPHFQGNPYELSDDILERHGAKVIEVERTFEGIKKYLEENYIEGIVFWKDGEPKCKIKRRDFGFKWGK